MSYKSKLFHPLYDGYDLIIEYNKHYYCYNNLKKEKLYDLIKNNLISTKPHIQFVFSSFIKSYENIVFLNKKDEQIINTFINQYETLLSFFSLYSSYNTTHKLRELIINTYYFIYINYLKDL